jgi:hypothetical protein
MKTAITELIEELQSHLNGLGVMQYNSTSKIEKATDNAKMKTLSFCIDEAKKLLEKERQQIIDANNYKYENLNLKAEIYFEKTYLCKDNQ